jgi:hypothetical protein
MKNATPKPKRATKDTQGKASPNAAARKHTLDWVKGRADNTIFAASGSWLNEKNVPHRKVIGRITKLLKVFMFWWLFITKATRTPKSAKTKQDESIVARNNGLISSVGESNKPTANMAEALRRPLRVPINVLPSMIEYGRIGDIKSSSKLL